MALTPNETKSQRLAVLLAVVKAWSQDDWQKWKRGVLPDYVKEIGELRMDLGLDDGQIHIRNCPSCGSGNISQDNNGAVICCGACGVKIFSVKVSDLIQEPS